MREISAKHFYGDLRQRMRKRTPLHGQIEITYRCGLNCIHCYCKGLEDKGQELSLRDWQRVLGQIQEEGCVYLCFSGGDPLVREDFLELYYYAKNKGFIITLMTNAMALSGKILKALAKSPPYSVEVTLNGITAKTYESISCLKGSFRKVMENLKRAKRAGLLLVLKSNCLRQNKGEIVRIKQFADGFLGGRKGRYYFHYDPMVHPRLNCNQYPTELRLSFQELLRIRSGDKDFWGEHKRSINAGFPKLPRGKEFLYQCSSFLERFFINPFGRLKFCHFSDKFSVDLKTDSFRKGFFEVFPRLLGVKFSTDSPCRDCRLRPVCGHCPARAYLETGNEEAPLPYYCELAKEKAAFMNDGIPCAG